MLQSDATEIRCICLCLHCNDIAAPQCDDSFACKETGLTLTLLSITVCKQETATLLTCHQRRGRLHYLVIGMTFLPDMQYDYLIVVNVWLSLCIELLHLTCAFAKIAKNDEEMSARDVPMSLEFIKEALEERLQTQRAQLFVMHRSDVCVCREPGVIERCLRAAFLGHKKSSSRRGSAHSSPRGPAPPKGSARDLAARAAGEHDV